MLGDVRYNDPNTYQSTRDNYQQAFLAIYLQDQQAETSLLSKWRQFFTEAKNVSPASVIRIAILFPAY